VAFELTCVESRKRPDSQEQEVPAISNVRSLPKKKRGDTSNAKAPDADVIIELDVPLEGDEMSGGTLIY